MKVSQCWLPRLHSWPHAFNGREYSVYNFERQFQRYSSSGPYQGAKRKLLLCLSDLIVEVPCKDRHLIYAITISLFKTDSWTVNLRHGSFIAEWLVCYQLLPIWVGHLYMWDLESKFITYWIPEEERELISSLHSRLTSWKVISLYPISKHWHWEKSGTGLAL